MSKNGHNGEGLPGSLAAFMLSHLKMPPPVDRLPEIPVPLSEIQHLLDKPQISSVDASVDAQISSVDAVLEAQKEMLRMMASKGYPIEQIKTVIEALGKQSTDERPASTDNRQTKEDLATLERRRERDRKYQEGRRRKVKLCDAASVDAKAEYISSSLPSLEVDTNKESKSSGIRAREWFEKLWRVYPKRQGGNPRKPAEDQFNIALKNGHDPERIIAGAEAYALSCKRSNMIGTAYVAHARTWLRQQRWNDDYSDHGGSNARPGPGLPHTPGAPRKENGAQRAYRIKHEAIARQSRCGPCDPQSGVVELDASEWSSGDQARADDNGTSD